MRIFQRFYILMLFGVTFLSGSIVQDISAQTKSYDLYDGSISVDFSPDGKYIATGDPNGRLGLWDVRSGANIYYRTLGGEVEGVAFGPDGIYIAADGANGGVRGILLAAMSEQLPSVQMGVHGSRWIRWK